MKKKTTAVFFVLLVFLCGCSTNKKTEKDSIITIHLSDAEKLSTLTEEEDNDLISLSYSVPHCDKNSSVLYGNSELVQNEQNAFYVRSYYQPQAQFNYKSEIYAKNLETEAEELLYTTEEAYLVNEMSVNKQFLYWVEYVVKDNVTYYLIREYKIETGEVRTIVEKNAAESMELCPAASEDYLAWYEESEGNVNLRIYDIKKNRIISNFKYDKMRYTPYGRPYIVDGYIAFWIKKDEQIGICRYCIKTGRSDLFMLESKEILTLKNFYCDADTIGWFTDYNKGKYFFYQISTGKLWYIESNSTDSEERYIYSRMLKGQFYYYDSRTACLHCIDFKSMKEKIQYIDQEQKTAFFVLVNEQNVGIRTSNQEGCQFYVVD